MAGIIEDDRRSEKVGRRAAKENALISRGGQRVVEVCRSWLRSAEQLPSIDVASQTARRNSAQIVNASSVGTAEHARISGRPRQRITSGRRRSVFTRAIFLDRMTDQRAGCGSDGGTDNRAPSATAPGEVTNDRAGARASRSSLTSRRVARVQTERREQTATNNC